jgi:tetratricopeptide (TPR) repeat protein
MMKEATSSDTVTELRRLIAIGRHQDALDLSARALERSPDDVGVAIERAQLLALPVPGGERPAEALRLLRHLESIDPDDARLHRALGFVHELGERDYAAAIGEYQRCLDIAPDSWECHLSIARLYGAPATSLSIEQALAHARSAAATAPDAWEAHRERAKLAWELGRLEEALEAFQSAARIRSRSADAQAVQLQRWIEAVGSGQSFREGFLGETAQ